MTHDKSHGVKKKKKLDGFTMENVQVKCESDKIKHLNFINDKDLKTYHDTYVKLNTIHNMDAITYYITESDLNKICDDKINKIRLKLENTHHKTHEKKQEKTVEKHEEITYEMLNADLELLLAKLNNDDEFKDDIDNLELKFDILDKKNIYYDISDTEEYDTFVLLNENGITSYCGMTKNSVSSFALVEQDYMGKTLNYELNNGMNALFFIYSKKWPIYTYPVYVIIHDYKFTTKKFIIIFNTVIDLVVK
jgi:hypothetical protein